MEILRHLTRWPVVLLAMAVAMPIIAQEGYPLKGSWIGVWEGNAQLGDDVLVIMNWDGEKVSGIINPGTDNIDIDNATLDPAGWKVTISAGSYMIEGTIEHLELPGRSIVGTWKSDSGSGKFEITRQ